MGERLPAFAHEPGGGERLVFGEATILIRASAEATGGRFTLFEEVPPLVDTPLHVHDREDELFYVLEGEHVFQVGDEEIPAGPGGLVFAPRGIPHAQRRAVPQEGRLLVVTSPGGLEGFFRELAAAHTAGTLGPDVYTGASQRYGITWLPSELPAAVELEGTEWTLVELHGEAVVPGESETAPHIALEPTEARLSGSGGCNRLMGGFERDGDNLRFTQVGTTKMACPEPVMRREAAFLDALAATTRFELDGSSLALLDGDRTIARLAGAAR